MPVSAFVQKVIIINHIPNITSILSYVPRYTSSEKGRLNDMVATISSPFEAAPGAGRVLKETQLPDLAIPSMWSRTSRPSRSTTARVQPEWGIQCSFLSKM